MSELLASVLLRLIGCRGKYGMLVTWSVQKKTRAFCLAKTDYESYSKQLVDVSNLWIMVLSRGLLQSVWRGNKRLNLLWRSVLITLHNFLVVFTNEIVRCSAMRALFSPKVGDMQLNRREDDNCADRGAVDDDANSYWWWWHSWWVRTITQVCRPSDTMMRKNKSSMIGVMRQ